jgi:hypothetical protein
MRHPAYRALPNEQLEPTTSTPGATYAEQCKALRELRDLQNAISAAHLARDTRLTELGQSRTVSRRDMARACSLAKSRIDQIIAAQSATGRKSA